MYSKNSGKITNTSPNFKIIKMFIYLFVYSNNKKTLHSFLKFLNKLTRNKVLKIKFFSSQHTAVQKNKKFTVLKSPHINKKAQEHFKLCKYQVQIQLNLFQTPKLLILLKKIQSTLFQNIFVKIKITILKNNLKTPQINPHLFNLKRSKHLLKFSSTNYVKIFDTFGELFLRKFL